MSEVTLFVRKASGLVRSWSVFDAFIYATFSINLITLGLFIFSYCYYFEGNLATAVIVGAVFTIFEVIVYASLISAMPRAGGDYVWHPNNAPAMEVRFSTLQEVLEYEPVEVAKTAIGRHTLDMIDYFLYKSKGLLPVSPTDSQSPLNMVSHLCPMNRFLMDMILAPENVVKLMEILADLSIAFNAAQLKMIGEAQA